MQQRSRERREPEELSRSTREGRRERRLARVESIKDIARGRSIAEDPASSYRGIVRKLTDRSPKLPRKSEKRTRLPAPPYRRQT
jgi:hypothetical protein